MSASAGWTGELVNDRWVTWTDQDYGNIEFMIDYKPAQADKDTCAATSVSSGCKEGGKWNIDADKDPVDGTTVQVLPAKQWCWLTDLLVVELRESLRITPRFPE